MNTFATESSKAKILGQRLSLNRPYTSRRIGSLVIGHLKFVKFIIHFQDI